MARGMSIDVDFGWYSNSVWIRWESSFAASSKGRPGSKVACAYSASLVEAATYGELYTNSEASRHASSDGAARRLRTVSHGIEGRGSTTWGCTSTRLSAVA